MALLQASAVHRGPSGPGCRVLLRVAHTGAQKAACRAPGASSASGLYGGAQWGREAWLTQSGGREGGAGEKPPGHAPWPPLPTRPRAYRPLSPRLQDPIASLKPHL